jgi:hypothetical protein
LLKKVFLLLILMVYFPLPLFGSELNVDGEVRLRYEVFNNFNDKYYGESPSKGEAKDVFLLSRIRLGLDYKATDTLSARLCIQDARAFGWGFTHEDWYSREFGMEDNPQEDYIELSEAYLKKSFEQLPLVLIAGRQRITYWDGRIFGPGEWKNSGKWIWDAVKFSWKRDKDYLDLFYGKTVLHDHEDFSLTHRHGYEGAGIYGHIGYGTFTLEPVAAMKINRHGNELYNRLKTYYGGLRFYDTDLSNLFYDAMFIRSFGTKRLTSGKEVDISAYGYHAEVGYNYKSIPWKPRFGMAYSFAKGDNPATEKDERFDGVFGATDRYYGRMNLMQWSNLRDEELFIVVKPDEQMEIKGEYHRFLADEKGDKWLSYKIASMTEDHYGDEIDVVATHTLNKSWGLQYGIGYFMPGKYIREASTKSADISDTRAWSAFFQLKCGFNVDLVK